MRYYVVTAGVASYVIIEEENLQNWDGYNISNGCSWMQAKRLALSLARNDKAECQTEIERLKKLKKKD